MKVLYDSTTFSSQVFGGISHYFVELMNHLPHNWQYDLTVKASENEYLPLLRPRPRVLSLRHVPEHKKLYNFINRFADRAALKADAFDIFHPTDYRDYFFRYLKRPYVITVHDMQFLDYVDRGIFSPEYGEVIKRVILNARGIIAISNTTRENLLNSLDVNPDRVSVVYHGFQAEPIVSTRARWLPSKYILYVGQRSDYKNFSTFFEAFKRMAHKDPDLNLVCTGKPFTPAEKDTIARAGLMSRVHHRLVRQHDMHMLYAHAACFVFPSRMEGFGMPVLEAYAAGCPVALSNASCLPEIGGNGALYFHPGDPDQMVRTITALVYDPSVNIPIRQEARRRLRQFSWEKCGRETAQVYEKTLGSL
ncbi:MAG: glycosyltransferase family 4 protein [Muribaculaceae bacterium]|nr:glycosyltransferase family 4 protein [Muribaculaceae bacterium]